MAKRLPMGLALAVALVAVAVALVVVRLASGPSPKRGDDANESPSHEHVEGAAASEPATVSRTNLSGHVRDTSGAAIAGATVCAAVTTPDPRRPSGGTSCTQSGDDGAFAFDDLPASTSLALVASSPGRQPSAPARVRLVAGERRGDVDLVVFGEGAPTRGRVRDALGGVVAGASVMLSLEDARVVSATTDARGEFNAWVGAGFVTVTVTSPGYATATARGNAPDRFFELALVPGASISGRAVERTTGNAVAGAKIDAVALDGGRRQIATTGDDGAFRIEGLTPGRYHLEGLAPQLSGYARTPVLLAVGESATDVVVELEPSPSVAGRVVEEVTRAACPAGQVMLRDKRTEEYAHAAIEPDGTVKLVAVLPGTYEVEVSCEGHASKKKLPVVVVRDRPLEGLEWEVERGTHVTGLVVDSEGKPIGGAKVDAVPEVYEEGGTGEAITDARGRFEIRGLGATKYTFAATARGSAPARAVVELGRRDRDDVRLTLGRGATIAGKVVDVDGAPVVGATVQVSGRGSQRVDTSADGSFTFSGLGAGTYRVGVRADDSPRRGMRVVSYGGRASGDLQVTAKEGETARAQLVLERRSDTLEGVVVDAKGAPLADFFVEATRIEGVRASATRYDGIASGAVTDPTGRFRIEKLGAGDYTVRAFRPGGAEGVVAKVTSNAKNVTVKISTGSITGIVTARGVRQERFQISIQGGSVHRSETLFHTNGAFTLRDLPPGDYEVSAQSAEGSASTKVTVAEDRATTVSLSLERAVEATD
ncbi:MAG: carboxypeptidase regulatory-like domain-containing protein [Deltaproteobacteria bacterium]|nr:carboxypeptidase regulatory-like domain-containing protein [Deltaproteobacteria bacterium]